MAELDQLEIKIQADANAASTGIQTLITTLGDLKTATKGGAGLSSLRTQLKNLNEELPKIKVDGGKINDIATALSGLSRIQRADGLSSAIKSLEKIPTITKALNSRELQKFGTQIKLVTKYIQPLGTEINNVTIGLDKLPGKINRVNTQTKNLGTTTEGITTSCKKMGGSFVDSLRSIDTVISSMKRVASVISGWIKESNSYVENLNLFTVAMGDYAESAQNYADQVAEIMGIDPGEWMRNQGVFMTLTTGFGVASDKAALMSKNLTQLGYDLSSFFNISVEDAMQKLQSGISGELEPLRRLGYDLSQAKLEAIALDKGITKSVSSMTQAEKAQLRYYAIMTQVTTAQGDMARTLEAPANQLRILKASATQAARALGNVFIPALNAVLPYAIAFLNVIRMVAQEIANFFGFTLPEVDYSDVSGLASAGEDAENALEGATDAAKKLNALLGIDELTILEETSNSSTEDILGGDLGIDLPEYDFLGDVISSRVKEIETKWKPALEDIFGLVGNIGLALLAWKFADTFTSGLKKLITEKLPKIINYFRNGRTELDKWETAMKGITGVVLITLGAKISYDAGFDIASGDTSFVDWIKAILGPVAAGLGGSLLVSSLGIATGGVGFVIGLVVGVLFELAGIVQARKAAREEASYQEAIETIKNNSSMAVTDALELFNEWYEGWKPNNQVVIELVKAKEGLAEDIETAHSGLKETFDLILEDGVLAKDELGELTTAMENYFKAITADTSNNNDIIHEALVGALSRASADGVGYYQDLIDKHNDWVITEQGALGALKQQANDAAGALALAAPDTKEYSDALASYNEAMEKLAQYTKAENTAQLQIYSEKITELKNAISSGELDMTDLEAAKTQLETLAGKYNSLLEEIDLAEEGVVLAVQTEINRAVLFGDDDAALTLGNIKTALEKDFEGQRAEVVEAANGIGATIATAIGNQMFNLVQTTGTGRVQELVDEQYVPLLNTWATAAEGVITNSEQLIGFPQLALDTITSGWLEAEPDLDENGYAVVDTWGQILLDSARDSVDTALANTGLGAQAQAFMDLLTSGMSEAEPKRSDTLDFVSNLRDGLFGSFEMLDVSSQGKAMMDGITAGFKTTPIVKKDIEEGVNNLVNMFNTVACINSPAEIMVPSGEYMMAGVEKGMTEYEYLQSTYTTIVGDVVSEFDDAMAESATNAKIKGLGSSFVSNIEAGIKDSIPSLSTSFGTMLNALLTKFETFANRVRNAMNTTLSNFSTSMASVTVSSSGGVTYKGMSYVSIPRFASGGFPETGSLFFAQERGPELVGTIGGKTAVANNDQIIAGISAGVQNANEGVITAIYSMCRQVVSAVENNGGVYLNGKKVSEETTKNQNRQTRMYGKPVHA